MIYDGLSDHSFLYDEIAEWYVRTFYSDHSDLDWLELFAEECAPGSWVADIGCGPGQYARFFRARGMRCLSIDISLKMLSLGLRLDPLLIPVCASIHQSVVRDNSLGGILAAYTLEHVHAEDTDLVAQTLRRQVKPGGFLALMFKCGDGYYEFRSSLAPGTRGFVQLWEPDVLARVFERNGWCGVFADRKPPASAEEFNHERGFLLLRKC